MKAGLAWQINNPYRPSSFPTFSGQFAHQLIAVPLLQLQGHHEWKLAQTMPNTHLRKPCCLLSWGYLMLYNLNKKNNFFCMNRKFCYPKNNAGKSILLCWAIDYSATPNNKMTNHTAEEVKCLTCVDRQRGVRQGPAPLPCGSLPFSRNKLLLSLQACSSALPFIFLRTDSTKLQGWGTKKNGQKLQAPDRALEGTPRGTACRMQCPSPYHPPRDTQTAGTQGSGSTAISKPAQATIPYLHSYQIPGLIQNSEQHA